MVLRQWRQIHMHSLHEVYKTDTIWGNHICPSLSMSDLPNYLTHHKLACRTKLSRECHFGLMTYTLKCIYEYFVVENMETQHNIRCMPISFLEYRPTNFPNALKVCIRVITPQISKCTDVIGLLFSVHLLTCTSDTSKEFRIKIVDLDFMWHIFLCTMSLS
jgi:hypothetical protein